MLVYHKDPIGYVQFGRYRVYGEYYNYGIHGPADIPRKIFLRNREQLIEVAYTKDYLEERYGGEFPSVKFRQTMIRLVDFKTTIELARALGIDYKKSVGKSTRDERRALRRSIVNKLEEGCNGAS